MALSGQGYQFPVTDPTLIAARWVKTAESFESLLMQSIFTVLPFVTRGASRCNEARGVAVSVELEALSIVPAPLSSSMHTRVAGATPSMTVVFPATR